MVKIRNGRKVEATGDTALEAIWALKRTRSDDLLYIRYESLASPRIVGVDVRPARDEMSVISMTVEES